VDDLNRKMQDAERARARRRQAVLERHYARSDAAGPTAGPLARIGDGWELGGEALRDGRDLEVFVQGVGWVAGAFRGGERPGLTLRLGDPSDPSAPSTDAVLTLPEGAVCRPRG
jgi:hypothetical protein